MTISGRSKAYPFSALDETPVVNDVFQGVPLLVAFHRQSATGAVFSPVVDGQRLTFQEVAEPGEFLIRDAETGTLWDGLSGVARKGPLAGAALERVASHYEFWFAWKDYRPDAELYQVQPSESGT